MQLIRKVNARVRQDIKSLPDPEDISVVGDMTSYEGEVIELEERARTDGTIYYRGKGYAWYKGWLEILDDKLAEVEEL